MVSNAGAGPFSVAVWIADHAFNYRWHHYDSYESCRWTLVPALEWILKWPSEILESCTIKLMMSIHPCMLVHELSYNRPYPEEYDVITRHEIHETCNSMTLYFMKNSFSDISRKFILPNMIRVVPVIIIFVKMQFLLIRKRSFHEIKHDGTTSFMEFK